MGEFYNPDKLYKGGSRNNSLINKKMIFRVLGVLLFIESAMFLLCAAIYKPQNKMFHFCKTFCSKITLVNTIQNVI